jgi:hypothetical protein
MYSDVVEILDATNCYGKTTSANLNPTSCMTWGTPMRMNNARGSLAVASFLGFGSVGGGAAMFAGGKTETAAAAPIPIPWATADFYVSASATSPILNVSWFNLSVPRFDLSGVGFTTSGSDGRQQALFAGGSLEGQTTSNVVDVFLFGGAIPDIYSMSMSLPRTRPQLGQLGNRYGVVVAGSTCTSLPQGILGGFFCCGATNIDIFDLQNASSTAPPPQAYRADLPQQPSCTFQQARFILSVECCVIFSTEIFISYFLPIVGLVI